MTKSKSKSKQKRLIAPAASSTSASPHPSKKQRVAATTDLNLDQVDDRCLGNASLEEIDAPAPTAAGIAVLPGGVMRDELDIATETLNALAADARVMKGKDFKDFKTALYNLNSAHALASGLSGSLASRISAALTDGRWLDARIALSEMRLRGQRPRLGALQRWVRECDAASAAVALGPDAQSGQQDDAPNEVWQVLEAILRCTTEEGDVFGSGTRSDVQKGPKPVVWMEEWGVGNRGEEDLWEELQGGQLLPPPDLPGLKAPWKVLESIAGSDRRPPNAFPCILYHTPTPPLTLSPLPTPATSHSHPHVARLQLLTGVLTPSEAHTLVRSAEAVGLEPDEPLGRESASTLAHNLVWIVPSSFHDGIMDRIRPLLPQTEGDGAKLVGINRRWRIYRYRPGSVYRPHIDGGWPESHIDGADGKGPKYVYDRSVSRRSAAAGSKDVSSKPAMSRYTLLLYLNDGFEGGHTTFFVPSPAHAEGGVHAYPVRPVVGGAALFPHGAAKGSLLHEGSGVTRGAKYVVRTEVLYEVPDGAPKE